MTAAAIAADALAPDNAQVAHIAELLLDGPAAAREPTGFLTGTAGYGLALHALAHGPTTTSWDACLLLR